MTISPAVFAQEMSSDIVHRVRDDFCSAFPYHDDFHLPGLGTRTSTSCRIARSATTEWLYAEVSRLLARANRVFQFELTEFEEPLQVLRYGVGHQIDWHLDTGDTEVYRRRKLSLSIQLSDSDEYDGGEIEFAFRPPMPFRRTIGSMVAFPAFTFHRVTPVTRGERLALIVFANGAAFR
jgi:PKHD-type hydroxylase